MKNNIIFAALTAIILMIGFYAMNIAEYFNKSIPDENFKNMSRIENNAVYLSSNKEVIDPMSTVIPCNDEVSEQTRWISTAIVKSMARHDDITYIAWGIDIYDLSDAWQIGEGGYIYVDKWKYVNCLDKQERMLDCIIDTFDFKITYIRFYCNTKYQISANEMTHALDKFDSESSEFYPNLNPIFNDIQYIIKDLQTSKIQYEADLEYYPNIYNGIHIETSIYTDPIESYINSYNSLKQFIQYNISDASLFTFWLSPIGINDIAVPASDNPVPEYIFNEYSGMIYALSTIHVIWEFMNDSVWFQPSYSSKDGRIYQNITVNDRKLTVIYCVKEDIIEGYFFN